MSAIDHRLFREFMHACCSLAVISPMNFVLEEENADKLYMVEAAYVQMRTHRDYAYAAHIYQECLREVPECASLHHCLGVALMLVGQTDAALSSLQRAAALGVSSFLALPKKARSPVPRTPTPPSKQQKGILKKLFGGK